MGPYSRTTLVLAALSTLTSAFAQQERAGRVLGAVDEFTGAYTQRVTIDVPAFRGLEPQLALEYNSAGGNGFVGVGWSLTGVDYIERAHASTFDQATFRGDRLVPCGTGSLSPSCTSAAAAFGSSNGYYSTLLENFRRIKFESANNQWIVWDVDGVKSVYGGSNHIFKLDTIASAATYRWLLASRTDVHGNLVEYNWSCIANASGGDADCFPEQIRYGNAVIDFEDEPRHDIVLFGKSSVGTTEDAVFGRMSTRLRRIHVQASDGSTLRLVRRYDLAYDETATSPNPALRSSTVRSVMTSVTEYGKDGATSYPTLRFDYSARTPTSLAPEWSAGPTLPTSCQQQRLPFVADFDGNRCDDYALAEASAVTAWFSNCDGTFTSSTTPSLPYYNNSPARRRLDDFNGDGRTDLLVIGSINNSNDPLRIYLSDRNPTTGAFTLNYVAGPIFRVRTDPNYNAFEEIDLGRLDTGDFNADGLTDIVVASGCHHPTNGSACNVPTAMRIFLMQKSGTSLTWTEVPGPALVIGPDSTLADMLYDVRRPKYADFNGDGRTDIAVIQGHDTTWANAVAMDIHYSRLGVAGAGSNFEAWLGKGPKLAYDFDPYYWGADASLLDDSKIRFGDFNGDGFSDLVYVVGGTGGEFGPTKIWLSTGSGGRFGSEYLGPSQQWWGAYTPFSAGMVPLADFNGDGRTDVGSKGSNGLEINPSIGYDANTVSFNQTIAGFTPYYPDCTQIGDFDGDGRADIGDWSMGYNARIHRATGVAPDLLTRSDNGIGGIATIAYTPSSTFKNDPTSPVVQVVTATTVEDGVGGASTSNTTYAGGKYDAVSRRFLGFSTATEALPLTDSDQGVRVHKKTTFIQDTRVPASVEDLVEVYKGVPGQGGLLVKSTDHAYRIGAPYTTCVNAPPYVTFQTRTEIREFDESGIGCSIWATCVHGQRTLVEQEFDLMAPGVCGATSLPAWKPGYGNMTKEILYGNYDLPDDAERSIDTLYPTSPNLTGYVVDKSVSRRVRQGTTGTGAILQQQNFFYDVTLPPFADGSTGWDVPVAKGDLTGTARWLNNPGPRFLLSRAEYDSYGNQTATIDEHGHRDRTTFDATFHLFPTLHENAALHQRRPTYDPVCGVVASEIDPNGNTTIHTYDNLCRRTRSDFPGGGFEKIIYMLGPGTDTRYTRFSGPGANTGDLWRLTYFDALGRTVKTRHRGPTVAGNILTTTSYDARGRIASTVSSYYANEAPPPPTTTRYNALDREVRVTLPDARFRTFDHAYESGRYRVLLTDEESQQKTSFYDGFGEVTEIRNKKSDGTWVAAQFVHRLDRTETIDPGSNHWIKLLDSLGRVYEEQHPDRGTWNYLYFDNGWLKQVSDNSSPRKVTQYVYDAIGRKTLKGTLVGVYGQESWVGWEYDAPEAGYANVGRMTAQFDLGNGERYHWDLAGNLVRKERMAQSNQVFQYGFDTGNRPRWTTFPDGDTYGTPTTPLAYDDAGRLIEGPGIFTGAQYTPWGALKSFVGWNGVITVRTYDTSRKWLTAIDATKDFAATCEGVNLNDDCVYNWCGGQTICGFGYYQCCTTPPPVVVQDLTYTRDGIGRVTQVTSPAANEGWTFAFDTLGRVTQATSATNAIYNQTWTYDNSGNILTNSAIGSYAYGAPKPGGGVLPHAVSSAGGVNYTYDANGQMTGGRIGTITWDGDGMPTGVGALRFLYDANGRRIKREKLGDPTALTWFADGDYEINQNVATKYFRIGDTLVAKRKAGVTRWLHTDQLGSVMAMTDSNGAVVWRQQYHPFGQAFAAAPPENESHAFTGERLDESGLLYLTARYYDPVLGRFISSDDRIGADGIVGLNPYVYAGNDPVNNTDRTGHEAENRRQSGAPADEIRVYTKIEPAPTASKAGTGSKSGSKAADAAGHAAAAAESGFGVMAKNGAAANAATDAGVSPFAPRQVYPASASNAQLLIGTPEGQAALSKFAKIGGLAIDGVQVVVPLAKGDVRGAARAAFVASGSQLGSSIGATLGAIAPPGAQVVTVPAGAVLGGMAGGAVANGILNTPAGGRGPSPSPTFILYDSSAGKQR